MTGSSLKSLAPRPAVRSSRPSSRAPPTLPTVQLSLDGNDLGAPIDLYHFSKVTTTGVLEFPVGTLKPGTHKLAIRITGTNPNAVQSRFVGLDYVRLTPAK